MAKKVHIQLIRKEYCTPDITSFYFLPQEHFEFIAGQYLQLVLPHTADDRGTTRFFSIASSPSEKEIMLTIKEGKSSFKKELFAVAIGTMVESFGPIGKFTLED